MTTALLALSLALAAGAPAAAPAPSAAAPAPAETPPQQPRDWEKPPPGSKADQALWQSAHDVNTELVIQQHVAARLAQGAKASGYQEKLPDLAKGGALPQARADALSARLLQTWTRNLEIVQRQWPVSRIRVCQYELLNFEALMGVASAKESQVADARRSVRECVARASSVLVPLEKSNQELEAVLADIQKELASIPATASGAQAPGKTAAAAPAVPAPPAPAPAAPGAPKAP